MFEVNRGRRVLGVRRALVTVAAIGLASLTWVAAAQARPATTTHRHEVFVAPYGRAQATGSIGDPLASIQQAIARVRRGGVVEVRGGVYVQRFALTHVNHVTVRAYDRERVVLDGSYLTVPDAMSGMVTIDDSNHVAVEGLEITGYQTRSMKATPVGIYVHGGDTGVTLAEDHIHDMGNYNQTQGNFDSNALGIAVYGDSAAHPVRDLTITGNTVDHMSTGASETITLNGNVDHWRVTANDVYDDNNIGIDAIGFEPTISGRYHDTYRNRARNGLIADNIVHHIYSSDNPAYRLSYHGHKYWCDCADGIYVDGGMHIVIEDNTVYRADIGIEVASEHPEGSAEHIDVRDNFVWDSKAVGISTGGYCDGHSDCGGGGLRRPGAPVDTGQSFDNSFVNNTLYNNNTLHNGDPQFLIQYYAHDNLIANNIIVAGPDQRAELGSVPRAGADGRDTGNVVDHNLYDTVTGNPQRAIFGWQGRVYQGWRDYRAHVAQDAHSQFADPDLVSLAHRNLHLTAGSPAINAGEVLAPGIVGRWDFDHQPRVRGGRIDIGADELEPEPSADRGCVADPLRAVC